MKQNNFHKKHINKWLVFILCVAFTLQLFAVPMLALAENMENVPGSDTSAAGKVLPEPSASASGGANGSARQAQKACNKNCRLFKMESGSYLSSRAVTSQVLWAYRGLTSVFGMGTGGSL